MNKLAGVVALALALAVSGSLFARKSKTEEEPKPEAATEPLVVNVPAATEPPPAVTTAPPREAAGSGLAFALLLEGGGELARGDLDPETDPGGYARLTLDMSPASVFAFLRAELSVGLSRLGRTVDAPVQGLARVPAVASVVLIAPIIDGGGPYVRGGGGMSLATPERAAKTRYSEGSIDPVAQYGAGFEYPISRRWIARLDVSRTHQFETITGDFWAAGLGIGLRSVPDATPLPAPIEPQMEPLPLPEPPPVVVTPADRDGDGLIDPDDKCPTEAGPPDNAGCPWPDQDGDKIADKDDKCMKVAGLSPHGCPDSDEDGLADHVDSCPLVPGPEPTGCPASDRDGDSVLDDVDQCPDVPGDPPRGCPKKILVVKHDDRIEIKQQINFETGKAKIVGRTSIDILDQVAAVLRSNPNIKIVVEGHTDDRGRADFNLQLSDSRAHAVRDALVERGIDGARLEAIGFGMTKPIASNRSSSGRAANRRSEFKIVGSEGAAPKPAAVKPAPTLTKPAAPDPTFFHLTLKKSQTLREIAKALWKGDAHVTLLVEHNPDAGGADAKVPAGSVVKFPRRVEYTVQKGNTLGDIAKQQLGNVKLYKAIAEASKGVMPDANKMEAGMVLTIPLVYPELEKLEKKK